jgi:hypothetical protein
MVLNNIDRRVERYESGENTGDVVIIDNYGKRWNVVRTLPDRATGDKQAILINDSIREI